MYKVWLSEGGALLCHEIFHRTGYLNRNGVFTVPAFDDYVRRRSGLCACLRQRQGFFGIADPFVAYGAGIFRHVLILFLFWRSVRRGRGRGSGFCVLHGFGVARRTPVIAFCVWSDTVGKAFGLIMIRRFYGGSSGCFAVWVFLV